ncbi:uncharacterized protein LOC133330524 [Musca vetustissima]|uniref:uncharacterized protein LOC133330524 n=1 Tax=Musca vetustissima TaxID=27455 RepID=UPI002AB64B0C|nr:uncharacterized protein LOC133330524 [Musca vetustissima]
MAASIYATPPPDLSSEDTALSDVSNTSSTNANTTTTAHTNKNNQHNNNTANTTTTAVSAVTVSSSLTVSSNLSPSSNQTNNTMTNTCETNSSPNVSSSGSSKTKRTIADVFKDKHISSYNSETDASTTNGPDNGAAMAAVAAAANAAMQMQFLEALNDAAKKRRKQHNPTRMDEDKAGSNLENDKLLPEIKREQTSPLGGSDQDYEDKLSKMFLPKSMEHLKETFEMLQQQKQHENISSSEQEGEEANRQQPPNSMSLDNDNVNYSQNPYHTFCKECGENFENEFKLSLHMLQEHNGSEATDTANMSPMDILASVKVKMERPDNDSPLDNQQQQLMADVANNGQKEQQHPQQQQQPWLRQPQIPPLGFPFPPEAAAAAALQAGGYLPLLAVPGFPGVDGLQRPPMRIFNPEAFCELCNKEFCNKYFLKTHKANKHGIYDPVGGDTGTGGPGGPQNSTLNAMNQMFQLQMQQQQQQMQQQHQMQMELAAQQQQQQQQQQLSQAKNLSETTRKEKDDKANNSGNNQSTAASTVYCDICSKRFTNIFAMRRHRSKVHEQNASANATAAPQRNSPTNITETASSSSSNDILNATKNFQMPDGFRQDFGLEQEEISFTPQPRKLSPQSQQQARDANFAHDKLKRLGVMNPEAFCELCCKEYCNKYFLRTHKWKRHGIFIPPEENENLPKIPGNWPFMNMPAVNLMMATQRMISPVGNSEDVEQQQPSKRIKLEKPDNDVEGSGDTPTVMDTTVEDENLESRNEENNQNNQNLSVPSTPEPQKPQTASPETVMGLQNLQKLQSMIQQLNDLNGKRPVACHLCGREMENQYALQAHIMSEHGAGAGMDGMPALPTFPPQFLLQQQQAMMKQSPPGGSPGSLMPPLMAAGMGALSGELRCTPCDREFSNLPEFQKHITEVHLLGNGKGSPMREGFVTPDRPVNSSAALAAAGGTRPPYTLTPTSSYCEICNKELCNKYFMKTHMQRMHGIEIENGAQIGGVVCNICNKELCSKYFLRVHKHNTHGIIDDGAPLPQPRQNGVNTEATPVGAGEPDRNLNMSPFGSNGSDVKPETSSYSDNCPLCSKRFRSPKWLRSHLLNDHGASGMEKLRELEQQYGSFSKSSSPTLKIPNGSSSAGSSSNAGTPNTHPNVPSPAQLAQALQNLNAQQLLQQQQQQQQMAKPQIPYKMERNVASPPRPKEYQCSLCSFTTPYYAFLFIHERTHSIMNAGGAEDQEREVGGEDKEGMVPIRSNEGEQCGEENEKSNKDEMEIQQPTNLSMRTPSPSRDSSLKEIPSSPVTQQDHSLENDSRGRRSVACSPVFHMSQYQQQQQLQEMAEQFGKTASYAVPRDMSLANGPHMQAFIIEEAADNRFVPAIIYLPVTERLSGPLKLSFNLTPV